MTCRVLYLGETNFLNEACYTAKVASRDSDCLTDDGFGEGSRYTAHLDRGWQRLDQGDLSDARTSAQHAYTLNPNNPDAPMLMAAVCLAAGDPEASVEWYDRAIEREPEYFDAYLAAAQVLLYEIGDPKRAISKIHATSEIEGVNPAEVFDVEILRAECMLVSGDSDAAGRHLEVLEQIDALEILGTIIDPDPMDSEHSTTLSNYFDASESEFDSEEIEEIIRRASVQIMRIARLWIDLEQSDRALPWLHKLVEHNSDDAELWYLTSEAEMRTGNASSAARAAIRVRELDAKADIPTWAPTPQELHVQVMDWLKQSSMPELQSHLKNGSDLFVIVHEAPSLELVLEGTDPRCPLLALGWKPLPTAENEHPQGIQFTGLAVYWRNLIRLSTSQDTFAADLARHLEEELTSLFNNNFDLEDLERNLEVPRVVAAKLRNESKSRSRDLLADRRLTGNGTEAVEKPESNDLKIRTSTRGSNKSRGS